VELDEGSSDLLTSLLVIGPTALLVGYYIRRSLSEERQSAAVMESAIAENLIEPASLHPVIDEAACIGCGSCVEACPEKQVLGLVDGKARLIGPTHCIGHGACKAACPTDAIELVFGTERRGVDIPAVKPDFETNVPGMFIAGELGGMGLIRNAITQGRQAIDSVRRLDGIGGPLPLDVVIVGAGPAGFSATLAAMQHGLRSVTLEQDSLGGTVAHYPRGKVVMTAPAELPIVGKVRFRETTKEKLLEFWTGVERRENVKINYGERVEAIEPLPRGFRVTTTIGAYETRAVLLAIGRRGTPRRLGVPGEEHEKVVYRLIDPEQYRRRHVLVVGGGDSALEAASALAAQPDTTVSLSYRSAAFGRAKAKNREAVRRLQGEGLLRVLLQSEVQRIDEDRVRLHHEGREVELKNDAVIVCAGGILPTPFLESVGIEVDTKHGTV
jgi:thioredoxin reductase/Pyruvate/2-oxoacid:ferredoxin oxidoreductase delta subunit